MKTAKLYDLAVFYNVWRIYGVAKIGFDSYMRDDEIDFYHKWIPLIAEEKIKQPILRRNF